MRIEEDSVPPAERVPPTENTQQGGQPQQGRPKNSKDGAKRKTKTFSPKLKAANLWACKAQDKISEILNPHILKMYDKKNMRSLSAHQTEQAEMLKFGVLLNLPPMTDISVEEIYACLQKSGVPNNISEAYNSWCSAVAFDLNRTLTLEEMRSIQRDIYLEGS